MLIAVKGSGNVSTTRRLGPAQDPQVGGLGKMNTTHAGAARRYVLWTSIALGLIAGLANRGLAQGPAPAPPPKVEATVYDMSKLVAAPTLAPNELEGKRLFVQRCALCHDLLGQPASTTVGPWVDQTTVKARGEAAIRQKIMDGSRRMPGWKHTFDTQQVDAVIAYMKTMTPDMRPKPGGPVTGPIE